MLVFLVAAQLAAPTTTPADGQSAQDRVTATEVFAYGQWRNCVLRETHHKAGKVKDHDKVADAAIAECGTKEANYASSLSALAQLYQLGNTADFVKGNTDKTRKALRDMAMKELK
ncbi:hypothetical protein HZF05_21170 [Sphingomonas sp. CGMCC 1.13654]|uniref:Uncharacterized protein n=1 Tax=Sphingomonas chungangi TaxID=2683589 RepID=A0A838LD69_9SPHN|nr:hypothetical protein [Sphingomonas chungangi]MBA2936599.1 hypothetical protein [Sphingomonas chungangi]MVW55984.1 hypothetical protein [Sphingomonas chungangi]